MIRIHKEFNPFNYKKNLYHIIDTLFKYMHKYYTMEIVYEKLLYMKV